MQIGQALRVALEHGMHTDMCSPLLEAEYVQRCQNLFWNVYILERQMSSLMGIPIGISEECISTPLPSISQETPKSAALHIRVKLSYILSEIDRSTWSSLLQVIIH